MLRPMSHWLRQWRIPPRPIRSRIMPRRSFDRWIEKYRSVKKNILRNMFVVIIILLEMIRQRNFRSHEIMRDGWLVTSIYHSRHCPNKEEGSSLLVNVLYLLKNSWRERERKGGGREEERGYRREDEKIVANWSPVPSHGRPRAETFRSSACSVNAPQYACSALPYWQTRVRRWVTHQAHQVPITVSGDTIYIPMLVKLLWRQAGT